MKSPDRQRTAPRVLDLVEEATRVLRAAPVQAWASYYLGALPMVLGFLYFWADMSRSAFARNHVAGASLGLGVLFLWMKFWQTVFARHIRAVVAMEPSPRWNFAGCWRILLAQSALQPFGLLLYVPPILALQAMGSFFLSLLFNLPGLGFFLVPLIAAVGLVLFSPAIAFFQNITVLGNGESSALGPLIKKAGQMAELWRRQNLLVLVALLTFGFAVLFNWYAFCILVPQMGKVFLGIESAYTRVGMRGLMNSTFFAAMIGLAFLSVDPLVKVFYTLRCFYAESFVSGDDLKVRLRSWSVAARAAVVILLAAGSLHCGNLAAADVSPAAGTPPSAASSNGTATALPPGLDSRQLDQNINEVINQDKYAWRLPRAEKLDDDPDLGVVGKVQQEGRPTWQIWLGKVRDWLKDLWDRLFPSGKPSGSPAADGASSFLTGMTFSQTLIFILIGVVVAVLGVFIYRAWRTRQRATAPTPASAIAPAEPDLADENTGAELLPEEGWTKLGQELLARGDYRLALRAFYLAGLAHLAARNLVTLAKFKSNRDYERELNRRGHAFPQLPPTFADMVLMFERVWYGLHPANADQVERIAEQVGKLRGVRE